MRKTTPQLGLSAAELETLPFARHYHPRMAMPQPQVLEALALGPMASALFPPLAAAADLTAPGYAAVETGYTTGPGFGRRVHCLTDMPGVTPAMWAWWFGWHGCDGRRYKLWHPQAHVDARWADGRADEAYLGRTSLVTEYIGASRVEATISFVRPAVLGLDEDALARQGAVAICARLGDPKIPIKGGWLVHHIRPTERGSEMRSRFWIGGETVGLGTAPAPGGAQRALAPFRPLARIMAPAPRDLLAHCGQEMAHLAGILPALHAEFGPNQIGDAA
ncbi:MAG: hypothetical protein AAFR50_07550 [Pseudomonadota bacterium]